MDCRLNLEMGMVCHTEHERNPAGVLERGIFNLFLYEVFHHITAGPPSPEAIRRGSHAGTGHARRRGKKQVS